MQKVETLVKDEAKVVEKEMKAEDSKGKKMGTINKRESLNLNLEKPDQAASDCCTFGLGQKPQLSKVGISKVMQTGNILTCFRFLLSVLLNEFYLLTLALSVCLNYDLMKFTN